MPSPSLIAAARRAPDARDVIIRMAERMRHHMEGVEGCCTFRHLLQDGYTEAEIFAFSDDARACIRGKPSANRWTSPDRFIGNRLADKAREIHRRMGRPSWNTPVVEQVEAAHG